MGSGTDSPEGEGTRSPRRLIVGLGTALVALVLLLNWLGTSAVPVDRQQFRKLADADMITALAVNSTGMEAELSQPVRVHSETRDVMTTRVYVHLAAPPSGADLAAWETEGVAISVESPQHRHLREIGGAALVVLLLGIGVWHLWSQVQDDRKGVGSPRRRLRELDMALADATITQDEYRRQAQKIWAEM